MSVYFIKAQGVEAIKVGFASNPESRLRAMQTGLPVPLSIIAHMPGTMAHEKRLHRAFKPWRRYGEWFHEIPPITTLIEKAKQGLGGEEAVLWAEEFAARLAKAEEIIADEARKAAFRRGAVNPLLPRSQRETCRDALKSLFGEDIEPRSMPLKDALALSVMFEEDVVPIEEVRANGAAIEQALASIKRALRRVDEVPA